MPRSKIDTSVARAHGSSSPVRSPITSPISARLDPRTHRSTSPDTLIAKLEWDHLVKIENLEVRQRDEETTKRRTNLLEHKRSEEKLLQRLSHGLSDQHHEFVCETLECHKYRLSQTERTQRLRSKKEALDQSNVDLIAEVTRGREQIHSRQEENLKVLDASQKLELKKLKQAYEDIKANILSPYSSAVS